MKINSLLITVIKDSRGEDTLKLILTTSKNKAEDSVPSGKSKGSLEAVTKNTAEAIQIVTNLKEKIIGKEFVDPQEFDEFLLSLDNTIDKSKYGGNTLLALSLSFWRLFALEENLPLYRLIADLNGREHNHLHLPYLMFNLINGGEHVGIASSKIHLPFQEYFIIPGSQSAEINLQECQNFIIPLKAYLTKKYPQITCGDEGGFVVPEDDPEKGLEILSNIKKEVNSLTELNLGLDIAANSFYDAAQNTYKILGKNLTTVDLTDYYSQLFNHYQLLSVEDPYSENDYSGFKSLNHNWGDTMWIIGDDLTTTNSDRLIKASEEKAINGLILKPNQIGTISETIEVALLAQNYGFKTIVSHRSGETLDNFIADLAVGISADAFKSGAPLQPERLAKYNRLVEIERELNAS
jgi:enolase